MIGLSLLLAALLATIALVAWRALPRSSWLPLAAALSLGLAGYAWQAHPTMPGQPVDRSPPAKTGGERIDKPLMGMVRTLDAATNWLMLADAFTRRGDTEGAARLLANATRRYPQSGDLWVGYGAALMAHADDRPTRASAMVFAEARRRDPRHPGPDFFEGIGKVREGDLDGADAQWSALYARTDGDAEWRRDLAARIALLRALIAQRDAAPGGAR